MTYCLSERQIDYLCNSKMWFHTVICCALMFGSMSQNLGPPSPNLGPEYNYVGGYNNAAYGNLGYGYEDLRCPENWIQYLQSCYKFVKSPQRSQEEARRICGTYTTDDDQQGGRSDLISINSLDEHGFIIQQLNRYDPQHRRWYIGAHQTSANYYSNPDNSQLPNMEGAIQEDRYTPPGINDFLVYRFFKISMHWALEPVRGEEHLPFICEAPVGSLLRWHEEVRSYTYGTDITDPERIPRGPYFIKQPMDATFDTSKRNLYNYITLSCMAGGYPTPTYKWYREDYQRDYLVAHEIDPLNDARYTVSGGTLMIYDPQPRKDRATYHCRASNKFGTVISESVYLNFGFILEFVLKRSPEVGELNWGKSLYCDPPNHFPSVRYSWSRDYFPNFVEEDRRVFVSNDGALYFSALEIIDRANYSCSVQSEFSDSGRNGPFFPLKVNPHSGYQELKFANNFPKAFPEAPMADKDVKLECMAYGYPVPEYNWTRKGGNLPRNAFLTSFNRVLVIPKVQIEDEGEYVCRAYNARNNIENSVILNIQAEPKFTIPLQDKVIDKKGELFWTCEAFGVPDVNYTWWKDGRELSPYNLTLEERGRIKIKDNILQMSYLDGETDPGMYQCRAQNTLKARYSSAQLRVLAFKPLFKKHPLETETYAADGGNVTIKCNPEAAPRPRFIWRKDGLEIGSGGHRRIYYNGNLFIGPVSRDDEGVYTCIASNELGVAESQGRLIVLRGPHITQSLAQSITTVVGRHLSLECYAVTDELLDIAYTWTHDNLPIRDLDIKNSNGRLRLDGGYLRIVNITFSDQGIYDCIVNSAVGNVSSRSHVVVHGPPGPPGGLQVMRIQKSSFTLQWTDGTGHGLPIYSYSIGGRTNTNRTWIELAGGIRAREIDRYTGKKEADVEVILLPWSFYEFRVAALNDLGRGEWSPPSPKHLTPSDVPYIAPVKIGGGGGKIGDLTITWTPLRSDQQNAPGIHYKVFWKRQDDQVEFQSVLLKEYGNTNQAVVQIEPKFYYTLYQVKVQAINDMGMGPISREVLVYSAEDMPQVAPQLLTAKSYNSTALKVFWKPIEETRQNIRGKLIGHRIKYWKKDTPESDSLYYLSRSTQPHALIVGLQPDTYYYVKSMAYNAAGEGPESQWFLERTFRKAPQKPPSSVEVFGINPSTVKVTWRYVQPSLEEEPLLGYKVRVWDYDQDISTANDTIIDFGDKLEGYVNGLSPGKTYRMRILAFSNGGDGRMSSPERIFQMGNPDYFRSTSTFVQSSLVTTFVSLVLSLVLVRW